MNGRIHSFQSFGTVDGPGVRAVVFLQGCPLRCACCHNPDTWDASGGTEISAAALAEKVLSCRRYFGRDGGVTVSGGEPLLQAGFVGELFTLLHKEGIHTALDTSGCLLNEEVKKLLTVTDLVLLDYKYTNAADYLRLTKCKMESVDLFLHYLDEQKIPTRLRQVIIPALNDSVESVRALKRVMQLHACVTEIELLPFRKLCLEKYEALGIPFPLRDTPEPEEAQMNALNRLL